MKKYIDSIIRRIIYIYVCIIPWITFKKDIFYNTDEKMLFSSGINGVTDYFLYGKAFVTIVVAVLLVILIVLKIFICKNKILDFTDNFDKFMAVCVCVFSACTIVSLILAKYKLIALWGGANSFEGTFVLLSYMVIFIAAKSVFGDRMISGRIESDVRTIVFIEAVVLMVLTCVEKMYKPVYCIAVGKNVEKNVNYMLSLTFYNPTYCAAFILLLLPFCMYFLSNAECIWKKVIWSLLSVSAFMSMILTRSTAAFYLSILEIVLYMVITVIRILKEKRYKISIAGIAFSILFLGILFFSYQFIAGGTLESLKSTSVNKTEAIHEEQYYKITNIEVSDNKVVLYSENSQIKCGMDNDGKLAFTDSEGEVIDVSVENNVLIFPDEYMNITAGVENNSVWFDLGYKGKIYFLVKDNNFYPRKIDGSVVNDISGSGYSGKFDNMFTGRGYIWRNSLPILKNTIVFGHGAGTYEMYFKQFDYVGLLNSQGNVDLIVDKPHNWYLQMACNEGAFAMIAVVALIVGIFIGNVKALTVIRRFNVLIIPAIISLFIFAGFSLLTDSYVTVNPVLWVIIGGMACVNYRKEKEYQSEKDK